MHPIESVAPVEERDRTLPIPIPDTGPLAAAVSDPRLSAAERIHLRVALWLLLSGVRRASATLDRDAHSRRIALARAADARAHRELRRALLRA